MLVSALVVGCGEGSTSAGSTGLVTTTGVAQDTGTHASSSDTSTSSDAHGSSSSDEGSSTVAAVPDLGGPVVMPLRVVVISDLNGSYGSTDYEASVHAGVAAVIERAPDLVLSTGDMVAGQQAGLDYAAMWAGFHAAVSDPLMAAGLPFAVTPGNHDASGYPAFLDERELFVDEWQARKPALEYLDDSAFPLRYSFVAGAALFVALDDTTIGSLAAEQMAWLEEQLVAGADQPAKIVFGHVPLWAFAQGREDEIIGDPALESLLVEHGVDLFVSGHHHAYYPGRRGDLRLVGTACIGAGPRALIGVDATSPKAFVALEIDEHGEITELDAWAAPAFDAAIDRASLPSAVSYAGVTIDRDDG
jgi:3',5'-cyclic AMP phosphodiesterase CpdA